MQRRGQQPPHDPTLFEVIIKINIIQEFSEFADGSGFRASDGKNYLYD